MTLTDLYINGCWVAGPGRIPVLDPATGDEIAQVATAGPTECEAAVDAAHAAADAWSRVAPRTRSEILRRVFELMTENSEALAELITRENGKLLADARIEVAYAADFFRWYAEEAVRIRGDFRLAPSGDKRIIVSHEPVGVSLLITPWNFPLAMAARKIAPALAAGCTSILKPAPETPLTALALADLLERAGAPAGVINVVLPVPPEEHVRQMIQDPRVRNLSFTGSTEVGRHLLRASADSALRTSMELGGNAPFVVLEGSDVDAAVDAALVAKMRNGGAACTAANRFYVHASCSAEFTRILTERMAGLPHGRGDDPDSRLGAMISVAERDKVRALVDAAVHAGARCTTGGLVPEGSGAFYPATVLVDVPPDAAILQTEIFGPVAPIVSVPTDAQALALANDSPFGLIAYVHGPYDEAMKMAGRLEAGIVAVNRGVASDPAAPFGGVKQSGLGREGGFEGIQEFLETRYIAVSL